MKIEVSEWEPAGSADVAALLRASPFKPWRCLEREQGGGLTRFWLDCVADKLFLRGSRGLVATIADTVVGLLVYSENPWETPLIDAKAGVIDHFVVAPQAAAPDIASSLLDNTLRRAGSQGIGFLLGRCYTDDVSTIQILESRGFLRTDTLLDCFYNAVESPFELVSGPVTDPAFTFRRANAQDRIALRSLASKAFGSHFGRFHADGRIGVGRATRIYEQWLDSSLAGYADWVDVAEIDGRIVGCSCWRKPGGRERELALRVGHYSISGIDPEYHGRGLFKALTYRGMGHMREFADVIEGPTHIDNHGVQAAYSTLNWRVGQDARHSFHKWLA